ncbi:M48 family metallopeptidase [Bulleidia sp. zg-1006]|uniref:M48 family metallopeptidase n=1 Tax=Bulleidia sp. zg-1006 TaxID=2806552 RepID=UPI00193AAC9B|nr:SprT-like domain-containing protein [Bulleidia sp. zg-1006]QRG86834.1 DUF45 domain-containing protein [Bulleidia sp. zg-1006]
MQDIKFLYSIANELYTVKVRFKNIRHLYLRVIGNHVIQISCNRFVEKEKILRFIQSKELWIRQHSKPLSKIKGVSIQDGYLIVFGQKKAITLKRGDRHNIVPIKDDYIITLPEFTQKEFEKVVQAFYRFYMLNEAMAMRNKYDEKIKATGMDKLPHIYVSKMKSRWGSFSVRTNRIHLNQQLIFYPKRALEAVLAHEYAHILVPNHSLSFYQVLLKWLPDYKEYTKLLKEEPYDFEGNDIL